MRIIAGSAKGCAIFAPKGQDTRPTQDRVRESLFNILQADVPDARVLDLFAGSGALALEALSRGAREATLLDLAADAVVCIQRNIAKLGFDTQAQVFKSDWKAAVTKLAAQGKRFDLVFLDPPYRMVETGEIMNRLAEMAILAKDALLVVEHRKGACPATDERFCNTSTRGYGDTEISFFRYQPNPCKKSHGLREEEEDAKQDLRLPRQL